MKDLVIKYGYALVNLCKKDKKLKNVTLVMLSS